MGGPQKETERRRRAAPTGPAKGLKKTAPGRRPFRGVATGTAFPETPRAVRSRLAGLLKAEPMLTHGFKLSTGLIWPVR